MFRGKSQVNLDAKGRIAIPTRYRSELQDCCDRQLVLTLAVDDVGKGIKGCIWLYPLPEWEKLEKTLKDLPTLNKMAGKLKRFLIGNASDCEMDNQGRVSIPETLRLSAGLDGQVILAGQLNKFEIWNQEIWQAQEKEFMEVEDETGKEIMEKISF